LKKRTIAMANYLQRTDIRMNTVISILLVGLI
jgi:hypothetical protein